jgi:DNA-binding response OmpR family regulator
MKKLIRNRQPVKVLVIEEDPSSLEIIKTLLNQNDFELLIIAPTMIKVDLLLETFQPNIILAALELNSIGVFDFIQHPNTSTHLLLVCLKALMMRCLIGV